jgi:hypothetical protein
MPNRPAGVGSYLVKARVGALTNGTVLSSTVNSGSITSNTASLTASSKPMVALNYMSTLGDGLLAVGGVDGYQFRDGLDIFIPSDGAKGWKGAESLGSPITFTLTPPSNVPGVVMLDCGAGFHNPGKQPGPSGGGTNNVVDSGTWNCDQPGGPGTPVSVTVTGMDSSLTSYPSNFAGGVPIANARAYLGSAKLTWWVPKSSLPQTTVSLQFLASNFDPVSSSGASNYGSGFASNYSPQAACVAGSETTDGNCVNRSLSLTPVPLLAEANVFSTVTGAGIPGGVLYANQPMAFRARTYNAQTNNAQTNATLCMRWDNQLAILDPSINPVVQFGTGTHLIEYGTIPYASETARKVANCGVAGDGDPQWHSSVAAAGGPAGITAVRVTQLSGSVAPAQGINFTVPMIRTSATIAAGTPIPVFTSLRTDQFGWTANSSFNPMTGGGLGGARSVASIAKLSNTVGWQSSTSAPGATREVTVNTSAVNPFMTSTQVIAEQVRLTVTLPSACQTFVSGSATLTPEQIIPANVGPDGIPCTADDISPAQLIFNLGDITTGSAIAPLTFKTNISLSTPAPTIHTIRSVVSSPSDVQVAANRTSTAAITINAVAEFTVTKQSSVSKAFNGVPFAYTIAWANRLSSTVGVAKIVDVLPFNGDNRGTAGIGSLQLVSATSATAGASIQYTTMAAAGLESAIAADPSGDTGVSWVSTMPSSGVTGVRIITATLGAGAMGTATLSVRAEGLAPTAQIRNDISAKAANLATALTGGSEVTVRSFSSSVSGNIYDDVDYSWSKNQADLPFSSHPISYTGYSFGMNGIDEGATGDDIVVTTPVAIATDAAGNYFFSSIDPGKYTFQVVTPQGYSAAQVSSNPYVISANQTITNRDFGFIVDVPNPIMVDDAESTAKGVARSVSVLDNDTLDPSALITAVTMPSAGGSIEIAPDGKSVTYTPAASFTGIETFSYSITDKGRQTGTATVTMTVVGPPAATDDSAYAVRNTAKSVAVTANDVGLGLSVTSVGAVANGGVSIAQDGQSVLFTPTTGFTGLTTFTYTVTDDLGQTAEATVTIRVLPPLVAVDDAANTGINLSGVGVPVTIPILSNDSGVGFTRSSFTQPSFGSVTFTSSGSAVYTPDGSKVGNDVFTYTLTDPAGQTATATVRVRVSSPPFVTDDNRRIKKDSAITIPVLSNDVGSGLEVISVQGMSQTTLGVDDGVALLNSNGSVTFTPTLGFTGLATFTYSVEDVFGQVLQGTVRVTVVAPPTAAPQSIIVGQATATNINLTILVTAPAGSVVAADSVTQPSLGAANVQSTSTVRYVAPNNDSGVTTFTYTVADDLGQTATSTINVRVVATPIAVADKKATLVDTPVNVPVLSNDSGEELKVLSVDTPNNGQVQVVNGTVLFTPNAGWFGAEVFDYSIEDAAGQTAMSSVTLNVFPELVAQDATVSTAKSTSVQVPVTLPFGSTVSVIEATSAGTFDVRDDGSVWFTPNGTYVGSFTVQYTIEDGAGQTATANLYVTVTDVEAGSGTDSQGTLQKTGSTSGAFFGTVSLGIAVILTGFIIRRRRHG